MLRNVVGQRARDRILQKLFVGLQGFAIVRLDLRRVEVHGHNADGDQHAQDDVQDRNSRRIGHFERQGG